MNDQAWNVVYAAFVKRLAELQARALAGDTRSQQILCEYELAIYAGYRPMGALAVAENFIVDTEAA